MKYNVLLLMIVSFLINSCGLGKKNATNEKNVDVIVSPELGIKAIVPSDVLYLPTKAQKKEIFDNNKSFLSLASEEKNTSFIYRASGSGGLGDDLNEIDVLNPYEGIPIEIEKKAIEPLVTVVADGDKGCSNMFKFSDSIIKIDPSDVSTLTNCNVKIIATGKLENGKDLVESKSFSININPTMKAYAENNDTTVKYLQAYSALSEVKLIAKWVKDANQTANLVLKYDPIKTNAIKQKLIDLNALTGAQNVKALDLSGTDLKDLRAIVLLENLEKLDISDTKIDPKDIELLAQLPKLKSLAVRNLNIKNIKFITNSLKNLVELDISGNDKISDLEDIQNLNNLRVLKVSNTGIVDLKELTNFTQLTSLDVSNNDLSGLTLNDVNLLVNLFNITELNFSKSKIKDEFLNSYFEAISNRNALKKLVIRNYFNRGVSGDCDKINIIDNIPSLTKLTNLEYLDLHGNGCNNESGFFQKGLTTTAFFSSMSQLQYLDISDTAVWDLSGVLRLFNLKRLKLSDDDGGISMTKEQCKFALRDAAVVGISSDCSLLNSGRLQTKLFMTPGSHAWTVPRNVFKVTLTGASGANGGSGGGGAGASAALFGGTWANFSRGGDGGNGGRYNGKFQNSKSAGTYCYPIGTFVYTVGNTGIDGGEGKLGGVTRVNDIIFSAANEYADKLNPHDRRSGGAGGRAGSQSPGLRSCVFDDSPGRIGGIGGAGGSGGAGWSTEIQTKTIDVIPGTSFKIDVGAGGVGGVGGRGGVRFGDNPRLADQNEGENGSSGRNGEDGFLKIEWDE